MDESKTNFEGGTSERVAYDMWEHLRRDGVPRQSESYAQFIQRQLDLYVQCLNATSNRPVIAKHIT